MTAPRSTKIDLHATPFYHCMSRCVRKSYLCGKDEQTGQDYQHRKEWIVARIKQLGQIFAIKICAYAVMSNHYHLVLFVNENEANRWSETEVLARWHALFPQDAAKFDNPFVAPKEAKIKIALWRERLMNISWFMRCINETIAKYANDEDNCKGRFWEGRFKSQALLDEGAVLAAMAYVDLNPIRSKIASTPEESEFASIYERIKQMKKSIGSHKKSKKEDIAKQCDKAKQPITLMAFANGNPENDIPRINFRLSEYLRLVDTTGRILREDKKGSIPENLLPIFARLNLSASGWLDMVQHLEENFYHAVGHVVNLAEFGNQFRERLPKGIEASKRCYLQAA